MVAKGKSRNGVVGHVGCRGQSTLYGFLYTPKELKV